MSKNGIKILQTKKKNPAAIVVKSVTTIGLVSTVVGTSISSEMKAKLEDKEGLLVFSSAKDALEEFKGVGGTLREDLYDIAAQNVLSPVVISPVFITDAESKKSAKTFHGNAKIKSAIVNAVKNLRISRTVFGFPYKVRISIAPWYGQDESVMNALKSLNTGMRNISIVDLQTDSVPNAITALEKIGDERHLVSPFYRKAWSVFEDKQLLKPCSAIIAGHIAYWDAIGGEFGFAYSHGNRPIQDVEGLEVMAWYEEGVPCDVSLLQDAGATMLINDQQGWELNNFETANQDERVNKMEYIRYFDGINEAIQIALKTYKHRPATDVLSFVKTAVDNFIGKTISSGATVGGKVWWSEMNTPSEIGAGRVYLDYDLGNNVGIREIILQPWSTDEYYTVKG